MDKGDEAGKRVEFPPLCALWMFGRIKKDVERLGHIRAQGEGQKLKRRDVDAFLAQFGLVEDWKPASPLRMRKRCQEEVLRTKCVPLWNIVIEEHWNQQGEPLCWLWQNPRTGRYVVFVNERLENRVDQFLVLFQASFRVRFAQRFYKRYPGRKGVFLLLTAAWWYSQAMIGLDPLRPVGRYAA